MLAPVRTPMWRLVYQGTDITGDIAPEVVSVTYTDHEHGKSDEIEVTIEDRTGKWKDTWYPTKGDTIDLWVGYRLGPVMPCGTFRLDEPEFSGPPDQVSLRGLAASITDDLRTKKSRAYEAQTLGGIAGTIAGEHGLSVVGDIVDVTFQRVTQDNETDLAFLKRLAEDYGHSFTVRGGQLIFAQTDALRSAGPVIALGRGDLMSYSLRDKTRETYKACEVSYQDPVTKELITHTVHAEGVESGDTLKRQIRVENAAHAATRARAMLDEQNRSELAGSLKVSGEPLLVAGVNVALTGLGRLSGTYHVVRSTHTVARSGGYTTAVEVERVS
jgi:phage protein D